MLKMFPSKLSELYLKKYRDDDYNSNKYNDYLDKREFDFYLKMLLLEEIYLTKHIEDNNIYIIK